VSGNSIDDFSERIARRLASHTSRRGLLSRLGMAIVAAPLLPLLPVARAQTAAAPSNRSSLPDFTRTAQTNDPNVCTYWRYCAIDGILCSCIGGGVHTCPAGAQPSPTSWVGTCVNPDDNKSYLIAYRDCCGKESVDAGKDCSCNATDRELPIYRPQANNDIIWCFGLSSFSYHCSTAALVGLAT
jgi:methylamine dehydrogenase light chain